MFFFKENKKFPYFPKFKKKKDYKIIALFILLLFFSIIFLSQTNKQIKTEVKAQKVLGASTIKKIKKITSLPPTSTPTVTQNHQSINQAENQNNPTATQTPTSNTTTPTPTQTILPTVTSLPTPSPTVPPSTPPTPTQIPTSTPIPNDDDIIIRPPINPKTTIYPLPTNPIFPPEQ